MKDVAGFILVNKPEGLTSHDVVDKLRRITGIKKIGHAGTLDPLASGLLILAVGRQATKRLGEFVKQDKEYIADIQLGARTDTYDKTGIVTNVDFDYSLTSNDIKKVLFGFIGEIEQVPPMYSAKKVKGVKLYELAREGIEVEREPIHVKIYDIDLINYKNQNLRILVKCGSGTYIRTLAYDIGERLGCGAYLKGLQRTVVGKYKLQDAWNLEKITSQNWRKILFE